MWMMLKVCVSVAEVEVFVCVLTVMIETKSSASHTQVDTHICLHKHTGALIHCRDYQWSMTELTLGSTGLCLGVTSYWEPSLCAQTVCVTVKLFVFARVSSHPRRVREKKRSGRRQERGKRGINQSRSGSKEEEGEDADKKICHLSLCLLPSLTRPHTVVSTMITERWSQSLASQKTLSRQRATKEKAQRQTELWVTILQVWMFIEMSGF